MKKTLLAISLTTLLTACATTPQSTQSTAVLECGYPDSPEVAAPLWVCSAPVEGASVSAVGSAHIGGAGVAFAKEQGAARARVELAKTIKVGVSNMIKQYTETTGIADNETVDQVLTSVTKNITSETLVGTRIFRTQTSPTKELYVLVGLDENAAKTITEVAIKTSMNNDRALWQKFQAGKAQDEMAAEILKMKKDK